MSELFQSSKRSKLFPEAKLFFRNLRRTMLTLFRSVAQIGRTSFRNTRKRKSARSGRRGRKRRYHREEIARQGRRGVKQDEDEKKLSGRCSEKLKEEEEEERGRKRRRAVTDGCIVEKLHPAHCIEIQEKERSYEREWRRSRRVEETRVVRRERQGGGRGRTTRERVMAKGVTAGARGAAHFWSRRDAENSVPI